MKLISLRRLLACAPLLPFMMAPGTAAKAAENTLDTVEVTAQRIQNAAQVARAATPGHVTLLDGEDLHARSVTQLADLLRYVPGVYAESYNGNDDVFYSSRGSNLDATDYDKNGIQFLVDGLPVSTADGNNHNRALDPLNARYVTIAHGANALAHGASTLGGAIEVTSPTAHTSAPATASVSTGSFGQWGARGTVSDVWGNLDALVSAETQQRDGYRAHSRQDRRNLYANFGWQASEQVATRLFVSASRYNAELPRELSRAQVSTAPRQARANAIEGDYRKRVNAWRVATTTRLTDVAGGALTLGASHEQQSLYHPIVSSPFFSLLIDTDHEDSGAMVRYEREQGAHSWLAGANYGFSQVTGGNFENVNGRRGALMWESDEQSSSLALFMLDRWRFAPRWMLVYGTQYAAAKRDAGGVDASYQALSPRAGLVFSRGTNDWYANVSRIHEAPTTFELTDDTTGGATALDAMRGWSVETGLRGARRGNGVQLHWDVAAYYAALRDEILSIDDPAAPGTSLSANIPRTTHAGIESLVGLSLPAGNGAHRIEPLLSVTFNAFSFDSDAQWGNNRLPSAPRWFARGEVLYRHANGLAAGPTFDVIGPRYVDFANSYRLGTHALFGARATFTAGQWEAYVEARNLLDRRHVATVAVRDFAAAGAQVLFPGAPRSVLAGLRWQR